MRTTTKKSIIVGEENELTECEENFKPQYNKEFEELFPIVDIEGLSLDEAFMQYEPKDLRGKRVKKSLIRAKQKKMKNFRKPIMDPSIVDDKIFFSKGGKPALNKEPSWWEQKAKEFMPEKNSRLISQMERDVFLGLLVKELVEQGYSIVNAWKTVCFNSRKIGHYSNSKDYKNYFEPTGSRPMGRWCDLANTCKIVKANHRANEFMCYGGSYRHDACYYPLAEARKDCNIWVSVGEIVLDA